MPIRLHGAVIHRGQRLLRDEQDKPGDLPHQVRFPVHLQRDLGNSHCAECPREELGLGLPRDHPAMRRTRGSNIEGLGSSVTEMDAVR